jgi:predicted CxxxxCH...CXXCH cytochrome family protein
MNAMRTKYVLAAACVVLAVTGCGGSTEEATDAGLGGGAAGGGTSGTGGGTASTGGGTTDTGGGTTSAGGGSTGTGGGTASALVCSTCHTAGGLSGAHAGHLTKGALSLALDCADCHALPTDARHQTEAVTVTFGALARTGGAAPTWTPATGTCSNAYCHGAKSSGGTQPTLAWDGGVDTVACGTCHGLAPTTGHVQTGLKYCSVCHLGVNSSGYLNVDAGTHLDGNASLKPDAGHASGWQPPGHSASIDFTTCTVCHAAGRSCSSCH